MPQVSDLLSEQLTLGNVCVLAQPLPVSGTWPQASQDGWSDLLK